MVPLYSPNASKAAVCILADMAAAAQPGDILLVLGARDPTLTDFAKKLLKSLEKKEKITTCQDCMLGNCCLAYNK